MKSGAAQQLLPDAHMASIGGTITHSPNTSGSDICWVLFHSSDINPIHQLFCQLPLSGLRGDCSFEGSEYCFILAPHLLLTKFDWIFLFFYLCSPHTSRFLELHAVQIFFFFLGPSVKSLYLHPAFFSSRSSWFNLTFSGQYPKKEKPKKPNLFTV